MEYDDGSGFLLPVPPNPADEPPQAGFMFNLDWLPYVLYGLAELRDEAIWNDPPKDIATRIDDLISKFLDPTEGMGTMEYPEHASLPHDEATVITGGAIEIYAPSSSAVHHVYNAIAYQGSGALGDKFCHKFLLKAGSYIFGVLGWKAPSYGKLKWTLDGGELIASQDWYAAALTGNVRDFYFAEIAFDGMHEIRGEVIQKNASSSGHYVGLTKYWFTKVE